MNKVTLLEIKLLNSYTITGFAGILRIPASSLTKYIYDTSRKVPDTVEQRLVELGLYDRETKKALKFKRKERN